MGQRRPFQIRDVMTKNPFHISPDDTLYDAREMMDTHTIRHLPVVDSSGSLLGILTLDDLLWARPDWLARHKESATQSEDAEPGDDSVRRSITMDPSAVSADENIQDAAERMWAEKVSYLLVLEEERLVGIVTESDIFRWIIETWSDHPLPSRRTLR